MSISPIGNANFINQNAPVVSQTQANAQARIDMQNAMALALAQDTTQEVAQIRPTEEIYKIDPENEHEKQKNNTQQNFSNNEENSKDLNQEDEIETEKEFTSNHILDIKI